MLNTISQEIDKNNSFLPQVKSSVFAAYQNLFDIKTIIANANIKIIIRQKEVLADMGEYFKS